MTIDRGDRQRVLVTGGAGFIGSHLVDVLCDQDHDVSILDDCSSGGMHNVVDRVLERPGSTGSRLDPRRGARSS